MLSRHEAITIENVATVLSLSCDSETVADMLNCLLCVESNPALSDHLADIGQRLFDHLTAKRPECVELAQTR